MKKWINVKEVFDILEIPKEKRKKKFLEIIQWEEWKDHSCLEIEEGKAYSLISPKLASLIKERYTSNN